MPPGEHGAQHQHDGNDWGLVTSPMADAPQRCGFEDRLRSCVRCSPRPRWIRPRPIAGGEDQAEQSQRIDRETGEQQSARVPNDGHGTGPAGSRSRARFAETPPTQHHQQHASNKVWTTAFESNFRRTPSGRSRFRSARLRKSLGQFPSCSPAHDPRAPGIRPRQLEHRNRHRRASVEHAAQGRNCRGPFEPRHIAKVGGLRRWRHS